MKKRITAVAVAATGALALTGPASAQAASIKQLAKAECKQELRTDTAEFIAQFGGTDRKALKRCVRHEKRSATRECKAERKHDSNEFILEYGGTDRKALKRCIRDELR